MAGCGCGSSGGSSGGSAILSGTLDHRFFTDSTSTVVQSGLAGASGADGVAGVAGASGVAGAGLCVPCVLFWVAVVGVAAFAWSKRKGQSA